MENISENINDFDTLHGNMHIWKVCPKVNGYDEFENIKKSWSKDFVLLNRLNVKCDLRFFLLGFFYVLLSMKKINFTLNFDLNILRAWCFTSCLELNGDYSTRWSAYWSYIVVLKINWTSLIYKLPYSDRLDYVNDGTRTCLFCYWKNFGYYTSSCKYIRVIFLN